MPKDSNILGQMAHLNIPLLKNILPYINFEMMRARRYQHALSFLVFMPDPSALQNAKIGNGSLNGSLQNEKITTKYMNALIGSILSENLRGCDMIALDLQNDILLILLVETPVAGAEQAAARLSRLVMDQVQIPLLAGISEFPDDGLTVGELVALARKRLASYYALPKKGSESVERAEYARKHRKSAVPVQADK